MQNKVKRILFLSPLLVAWFVYQFSSVPKVNEERQAKEITKNHLLGKIEATKENNFVSVSTKHSYKKTFLQSKVYQAFIKMHEQAKKEGIFLWVASGFRSFDKQKSIWEEKWQAIQNKTPLQKANMILQYSAMPGTSRHHWGTDVDINRLNNNYFEKGKGEKEYEWLVKNAFRFGFYQVYDDNENRTGYQLEKWHWSYLSLAKVYLKQYRKTITYDDIDVFFGDSLAKEIGVIENYVYGVAE